MVVSHTCFQLEGLIIFERKDYLQISHNVCLLGQNVGLMHKITFVAILYSTELKNLDIDPNQDAL